MTSLATAGALKSTYAGEHCGSRGCGCSQHGVVVWGGRLAVQDIAAPPSALHHHLLQPRHTQVHPASMHRGNRAVPLILHDNYCSHIL
jgi:hypothetical protein